jgi:tetratricopeptide (TPR) repeat protein
MDKKLLIQPAFIHFRDNQWDQAIEKYRQLQDSDPLDGNFPNILGDLYMQKGIFTEALKAYNLSIQVFNQQNSPAKAEMVHKKLFKVDPDCLDSKPAEDSKPLDSSAAQAIESLKQTLTADPKNVENYQKLGDLLVKAGRNEEGAEQYLVIANALYNSRIYKKAEVVFQRIIQLVPTHMAAHMTLGEIYSKEGSDSDAKKELLFVAEELIRQGNLDRAQLFAQKAIQLKSIEAHYYLGLIFLQKNQPDDARREFDTLLKFKVNHQGGLMQLARILINANQLDEAQKMFERLVKIDSKNAEALEKIGELAHRQGQVDQAKEQYNAAVDAFAADEQWERAAVCAHRAIQLDAKSHEYYLKLADASYNAGLEQQAAEACQSLADLFDSEGKPGEADRMRAKARELMGTEAAPVAAAPAVTAAPAPAVKPAPAAQDDIQVMMNIANAYIQQGSLDEAIDVYQKILKTQPNNDKVKSALTRVYAKFAGINPEIAVSRKPAAPSPSAPAPAKEPGNQEMEKEDQRVQREARERALREAQVRTQRSSSAAMEQPMAKQSSKETELLQTIGHTRGDEIAGDNQDEFMTVTVAEIYTKQGLLNEALKIYQKILEIEPGNMEAQLKKQELEAKLAEQEQLRQQSEKAAASAVTEAVKKNTPEEKAPVQKPVQSAPEAAPAAEPAAEAVASPAAPRDDDQTPPAGRGRKGRVSYV